ncbi:MULTISPECIES: hypothetical protein [Eubacterium]|jgi:hypothetical protein|uniref:hypothetical protein n=1 Tax=Eubacterium TaxID=1730 RepID=UPI00265CBFD8|nr:hypothetical protein [Eubacterium ventriosum]
MNFKDYIKQEYYDEYINERENLEDRLIEAKYNLLFLRMMHERSEVYRKSNATSREEIRIVLRRIYITVAWELALQIKAFTDDNDKDCITINKFKNNIFKYIKDEKKQEYYRSLGEITKTLEWNECRKIVSSISDYRNKVVGHNIANAPKLTFDINEADFVVSQYERLFNILIFQNEKYAERVADLNDEKANFITAYLDAVLPLN